MAGTNSREFVPVFILSCVYKSGGEAGDYQNLGVIPIKNSKFMPGIGRERTDR